MGERPAAGHRTAVAAGPPGTSEGHCPARTRRPARGPATTPDRHWPAARYARVTAARASANIAGHISIKSRHDDAAIDHAGHPNVAPERATGSPDDDAPGRTRAGLHSGHESAGRAQGTRGPDHPGAPHECTRGGPNDANGRPRCSEGLAEDRRDHDGPPGRA